MPEEKPTAELTAAINEAKTPEELSNVLTQERLRNEKSQFVSTKPAEEVAPPAPETFSDKFIIGGKEVEFTGPDVADVLRQYKAANQAYDIGRQQAPPPPAEPEVKKPSDEELQAARLELENDFKLGRVTAEDYLARSGAIDGYLKDQGIDPDKLKKVIDKDERAEHELKWKAATNDFIENFGKSGKPWPESKLAQSLMFKTLTELNLWGNPSPLSLQTAYDHLMGEGWDLFKLVPQDATPPAAGEGQEERGGEPRVVAHETAPALTAPPAPKKKAAASSIFNVSGDGGVREMDKKAATLEYPEGASPEQAMDVWKKAVFASGQHPNELVRQRYGGRQ